MPIERKPWAEPRLSTHPSMTALTRSVLGVADAMVLLQGVGGSTGGIGGGGPNGSRAGPSVTPQGGAASQPQH